MLSDDGDALSGVQDRRIPGELFKYISLSGIGRFCDQTIRFTPPSALNDPFEGYGVSDELAYVFERQIARILRRQTSEALDDAVDAASGTGMLSSAMAVWRATQTWLDRKVGVLCLSREPDNLLLWAHYASNHAGIVAGFDATSELIAGSSAWRTRGAQPMQYSEERVRPHAADEELDLSDRIAAVCLRKGSKWAYEGEFRCFREASALAPAHGRKQGVIDFDGRYVTSITYGMRIAEEDPQHLARLYEAAAQRFPRASLRVVVPRTDCYGLRVLPAPPSLNEARHFLRA